MLNFSNHPNSEYMDVRRHWHAESERYAGADCLLTAMIDGWQPDGQVYYEEFWHAGSRPVTVYHFQLKNGDATMAMPVIGNPYLRRMLKQLAEDVLPLDQRDAVRRQPQTTGARTRR